MPNWNSGIQQGAAGAALGAGIGGPAAPLGAAIGGGLGLAYGLFGGGGGPSRLEEAEKRYGGVGGMNVPHFQQQYGQYGDIANQRAGLAQQYGQRTAPISDQRGNQLGLGQILADEARGNGVGQQLVGMQARTAADRASAQQFAALGGAGDGG